MRSPSGLFLVASWRTGFSLFLWLGLILVIFFLFQCVKSLILGIKEQGLSILHLGGSRREVQPLARPRRARDPDIYTVNCPALLLNGVRHDGLDNYLDRFRDRARARPSSSPPVLQQPDTEYTLPNTPVTTSPPPYSSLYSEEPPAYDSLYDGKDNQTASTVQSDTRILPV